MMKHLDRFSCGMGIGGWLTNYKRFNVLPNAWRMPITIGDMEHFAEYISEDDVRNIAAMGFDHIRVGFDQIVLEEKPFVYRESTMRHLENFVMWCEKYNIRSVLNMHKAIGNYCDIKEDVSLLDSIDLQDRFVALWMELERRFAGKPEVMFELLNEVRDVPADKWNALVLRTVAAIRKTDPARYIIVGGTHWNNPSFLDRMILFDDERIIYTFHTYAPSEFTHQRGVLQSSQLYYNRKMPWPCDDIERYRDFGRLISGKPDAMPYPEYDRMDIRYIRKSIEGAVRFVKEHPDKILWCGEFGTIRHAQIEWRENWMRDVITVLKENDIPYSVWNYLSTPNDGNRFSLVDDDTRKILSPRLLKVLLGKGI